MRASPAQQQTVHCFSHSFQPLLQVDGDLQAVLVDQAAAAMTSASPAVVSFFLLLFVLVKCFGWQECQPKTSSP